MEWLNEQCPEIKEMEKKYDEFKIKIKISQHRLNDYNKPVVDLINHIYKKEEIPDESLLSTFI